MTERSAVTVIGRCKTGMVATDGQMVWFLTDCCAASAKGLEDGVGCRSCYELIDPSLGGVYDEKFDGPIGPLTNTDRALLARKGTAISEPGSGVG